MALDNKLVNRLNKSLSVVDDHGTTGARLLDDAARLWDRVRRLLGMGLIPPAGLDLDGLELACFAMQLPQRRSRMLPSGRAAKSTLRERCEEAAELLIGVASEEASEELLDRTTRILHETPHRSPMLEESKLLADAVNLEDFGITGLVCLSLISGRDGGGVSQLVDALEKRDQYGYWDSRLKDGFHFEQIREIAQQRLADARDVVKKLREEMGEDKL